MFKLASQTAWLHPVVRYSNRYQKTRVIADLEVAIQQYQEALDTTPDDHPNRADRLQNLRARYGNRYSQTGAIEDIEIAIQQY